MTKTKHVDLATIPFATRALTELAYISFDTADSLLLDAHCRLGKLGKTYDRDIKYRWKNMLHAIKMARAATKLFTEQLYSCECAAQACDDSDYMADILLLICDRVGGDENVQMQIRAMLYNQFPSRLHIYDELKSTQPLTKPLHPF